MRLNFGVCCLVVLMGCGEVEPGPTTVDGITLPVGDGQLLVEWTDVPVANVRWSEVTSPQNALGTKGFLYVLDDEARKRGDVISIGLEGADADQFEVEWSTAAGGQVYGLMHCVPTRTGLFEVSLVALVDSRSYRAKVRCRAVSDYAMFLRLEPACFIGNRVLASSGKLYDPATGTTSATSEVCYDRRVVLEGTQAWRVTPAGREPVLTPEEQNMMRNFGLQRVSPDGETLVFGDMAGLYVKRGAAPLAALDAWPGAQVASRNSLVFSDDSARLVVRSTMNFESEYLQRLWRVMDLSAGTNVPLLPESLSAALPAHGNRWAFSRDLSKFLWGLSANGALDLHFIDAAAGTQTRVFDDALTHVETLPGSAPKESYIVLTGDQPTLTPDGRYAALSVNAFTGVDYYGGRKGVYVRDLVEGRTWSVGVLPDGSWLSGDGWGYQPRVSLTDDGQNVLWAAAWSPGGAGNGYFIVEVLVPRRLWKPL